MRVKRQSKYLLTEEKAVDPPSVAYYGVAVYCPPLLPLILTILNTYWCVHNNNEKRNEKRVTSANHPSRQ